ncbi:BTAD domain-containing putative transcriptional regulator [Streptomyces boncukensis]|uniref:AfsR/SARP family transcriptional regulator n=1 Tax=Streptomyces boncukensis TaxID=2711219 RepID=A0A6G4X5H9_9ACTN|nr:AfsR/SARP family transcriptional regulator [Streptomyces boncukensis]
MGYRYCLLGTTRVTREDGTDVPVAGARLRALLTALALAGGAPVRTDALAAAVWPDGDGDDVPADEPAAVQALVGRLRRALGKEAVVSAAGGGYRLDAEREAVDLFRFERLADEGAGALADGDPDKAAALLDDALALWRGPALADLPDGGGASALRAAARHLAARRDRLEAALALGQAESVLPAVRQLAAEHPLDEPLQALRLRALRDAGRTAEALAAYEEVRAGLAEQLGADPGPRLRALHAELLHAEPAPAPHPAAPGPTAPGPTAPGPAAPRPARGNLRSRLTSFVGRDEEIAALGSALGCSRLVTLTGPGGAGKTRLSLEAAERAQADRSRPGPRWRDGVWIAELAPVRAPEDTAEAVLGALGGRETVLRHSAAEELQAVADPAALDPLAQLAERCATRDMLLVLDNCEHIIEAAARIAETLLVECPGVTVLATSREPLGVPGEAVRPVEPLPDPMALRLLADRGAAARPGFRVEDDPEACAELCRRLDGLPLAIELAAARLRSLTPRQLACRLDDRFRLLTSGSRTVLPRQQTLRAVVDWSWELLDDGERAVLRRLSVFSGGCELEQAEEVCGGPERETDALLGSLVDKSLVTAEPFGGAADAGCGMRYRLLETVAEYAAEKLDEVPGERAAAERAHLVAYRELARTADPLLRGPRQAEWLARLEREHDNVRTALRRAVAAGDEQEVLCLTLCMGWFWQLRDHRPDARTWAAAASALGPDPFASPASPAPPVYERVTDAPPPMSEELLWESRRGVRLMVLADDFHGVAELEDPQMQQRLRNITEVYSPGLPQTCRVPGCMWFFAWIMFGRFDRLSELADAMVDGCRALGYDWELAFALQLRAKLTSDRWGGSAHTHEDAAESLEIFRRVGDAWGEAEALSSRAEAHCLHGRFHDAADDYRLAIERAEELGAHSQIPMIKSRLGNALVETGDPDDAAEGDRLLWEAVRAHESGESGDGANFAAFQLAVHLGRQGRTGQARELLRPLEEELRDRAPALFGGMTLGLVAWTHIVDGNASAALATVREALDKSCSVLAEAVAPYLALAQLLTAARALAALGHPERAARLLGAYDGLHPLPDGSHPHPVEHESRQAAEEAARAGLSGEAFARAYAEGDGLSIGEAVALATEPVRNPDPGPGSAL